MGSSFSQRAIYFLGFAIGRAVYRVATFGREHLPEGGFLLLPNHISFVDAIVLQLACPRQIHFIIADEYYRKPLLHPILRLTGCIPIRPRRAKEAIRLAAEHIRAGDIVCVFPQGQLTRSGTLGRLQRGYELIARQAEALVVPVWLDQLWGSIFSFQGGRFFRKWPSAIPYRVPVAFGKPLQAKAADLATVREDLLELGELCFSRRQLLNKHLGEACVRGLKRAPFRTHVTDGIDHSSLSRAKVLGAAAALSRHLRKNFSDERIAIVLPAGKGAVIANLAVVLAGKVPVDLNFTTGCAAIESSCRRADLRVAISARAFMGRLKDFPWPDQVVTLDELIPRLKSKIVKWTAISILSPARLLLRLLQIPKQGGQREAVLLFTSGSSGEPKGVVLSHRNILGNVSQLTVLVDAKPDDAILASLIFFTASGRP